jgi:mannose/cellobiose epimerase-like protein (N-acyl-D-glucosamine 2-epimerase family)
VKYRSRDYLVAHIKSILDFYEPNIVDPSGGFFQNFKDDGSVFNEGDRHLVSSTRMVINYCRAYELFGEEVYRRRALHGIQFVTDYHWDEQRRAYNWTLDGRQPTDQTNHCYGLAFVLLMHSEAVKAKVVDNGAAIDETFEILETRFWLGDQGLYADEASADWSELSDYRGQNANMHTCEAMLAAYEATANERYLERAYLLARRFTVDLAKKSDGLIWEHFTKELDVDWAYNQDDPRNLYRPWGFQPGHQTEWAKLLLIFHGIQAEDWMIERATDLFNRAMELAWDETYGGIQYGFDPQAEICDDEKYFWVQAESLAAAARLAITTREQSYWDWYERIWDYADQHMIDKRYGAWFRVLNRENNKLSNDKSTAGGKCDYHTIGACWDVIRASAGYAQIPSKHDENSNQS